MESKDWFSGFKEHHTEAGHLIYAATNSGLSLEDRLKWAESLEYHYLWLQLESQMYRASLQMMENSVPEEFFRATQYIEYFEMMDNKEDGYSEADEAAYDLAEFMVNLYHRLLILSPKDAMILLAKEFSIED